MFRLVVASFLQLPALIYAMSFSNFYCFPPKHVSVQKGGDVVVGGFLPLHTYSHNRVSYSDPTKEVSTVSVMDHNYQYLLALVFAVEEINSNPHLLPNLSLGYEVRNVLHSQERTLESVLLLLAGQDELPNYTCRREDRAVAVLSGPSWATFSQTGTLLELYRFPQLNYGPFYPIASDQGQFSSLYHMACKETALALGMVTLLLHFSWTWVGLVIAESQNGLRFLSDLRGEMDRNGICVAFEAFVSSQMDQGDYVPPLKTVLSREASSAAVIVVYFDTDALRTHFFYTGQFLVTGKVWITNSQWRASPDGINFLLDSFQGTFIFADRHQEIPGFQDFIGRVNPSTHPQDLYLADYWYRNFDCSYSESDCVLRDCTPNASLARLPVNLFDPAMNDGSYNIYNAVYAVAHSLHEMSLQHEHVPPGGPGEEGVRFSPWQLHPFLRRLQFNNPGGDQVNLDEERKRDAEYDIMNFWNFPEGLRLKVKVGQFSSHHPSGRQFSFHTDLVEWPVGITGTPQSVCSESCSLGFRIAPQEGRPPCCFDCMPCQKNEISNQTDMELCMKCPDHQYANSQQNTCLQKSVTFLAYEDSLGMALAGTALALVLLTAAVLAVFVRHRKTPMVKANNRALSYTLLASLVCCFLCSLLFIGRPDRATCVLRQVMFGVLFTVAVSTVLAKTITVVLAFKVTAPGRQMRGLLVSGAPNLIIPICTLIQLVLCGIWLGTAPPFVDTDAHSEPGHIILVCNKGSVTAFYCVLGYLGSLAVGSFTVAFLARNLPDTFNEAKFLTFSMLVFCSVWVTFLPVYHSTKGKAMVTVEVFSILASSAGLLGCIFAPKCYIILLRPERNSLRGFRDEKHAGRNKPS